MEENLDILLNLYKLKNLLNDKKEKKIIEKLINKRDKLFLIDLDLNLTSKELGYAKNQINSFFNSLVCELLVPNYFTEDSTQQDNIYANSLRIYYSDKKHWLNFDEEYKKLVLIRAQFYVKQNTIFKKQYLELLKINEIEQIIKIIKNHYKIN